MVAPSVAMSAYQRTSQARASGSRSSTFSPRWLSLGRSAPGDQADQRDGEERSGDQGEEARADALECERAENVPPLAPRLRRMRDGLPLPLDEDARGQAHEEDHQAEHLEQQDDHDDL